MIKNIFCLTQACIVTVFCYSHVGLAAEWDGEDALQLQELIGRQFAPDPHLLHALVLYVRGSSHPICGALCLLRSCENMGFEITEQDRALLYEWYHALSQKLLPLDEKEKVRAALYDEQPSYEHQVHAILYLLNFYEQMGLEIVEADREIVRRLYNPTELVKVQHDQLILCDTEIEVEVHASSDSKGNKEQGICGGVKSGDENQNFELKGDVTKKQDRQGKHQTEKRVELRAKKKF